MNKRVMIGVAMLLWSISIHSAAAQQITVEIAALSTPSTGGDIAAAVPPSQPSFNAGETVFLEMWAQTDSPNGLAQVTADISFDATALNATTLTHTALFDTFLSGAIDNAAGLVDDAGGSHFSPGCLDQTGFTPNWARVATIELTAVAGGSTTIQAADSANPIFTVGVCSPTGPPTATYGAVTFTIFSNCGDGVIDPGETCDDGNTLNGDCCSSVCLLDPFLTPCDADADLCTLDICLADGTCVPTGGNVDCPPAGVCNGGGACNPTTGVCDTVPDPPAGTSCTQDSDPCTVEECDGSGACVVVSSVCADTAAIEIVALGTPSPGDLTTVLPASQVDFPTGSPIYAEIWAQTANSAGLTQVSADIAFNPTVLTVVSVTHSGVFNFFPCGAPADGCGGFDNMIGLIDNLSGSHLSGGCVDRTGFTPEWARVATIEMQAVAAGATGVQSSVTGSPTHLVAICGGVEPVTTYGGSSIAVSDCGNGLLEALEQCDDGNLLDGDCCSSTCQLDAAGASCNTDGDLCTTDTCDGNGLCVFQSSVTCAPPIPPCEAGQTCNSATGACDDSPDAVAGTLCDLDSNLCTIDECNGLGACVSTATTITCAPAVPPCEAGQLCDSATGLCVDQLDAAVGTQCDLDANLCTIDECDGLGTCLSTATNVLCLPAVPPCDAGEQCNIATGLCDPLPDAPIGTGCDLDATLCTIDECDGLGACVSTGTNVSCQPPVLPCEAGQFCNPTTGICETLPDPIAGTPCQADGDFCTLDTCDGLGNCVFQSNVVCAPPVPPCESGEACEATTGLCVPLTDTPPGEPCEADGDLCTIEACDGVGGCVIQGNVSCAPAVPPCESGETCNPATGLCVPLMDTPAGTPCDTDANLCTIDACDGMGSCILQSTVPCAPPVPPCEAGEACIPSSGLCSPLPDAAAGTVCDADGDLCTNDACDGAGLCTFDSNVVCAPAVPPCEAGAACERTSGLCIPLMDPPGGTVCNADGDPCTVDACDGAGNCVFQNDFPCAPAIPPCEGGEVCDSLTGTCIPQPDAPVGITCEGDGNLCTLDECDGAGNCTPVSPLCPDVCEDCQPEVGVCRWCVFDHDLDGAIGGLDFGFFSFCFGACYPAGHQCSATNYDQDPNNCTGGGDFAGFSGCFGVTDCAMCSNCFPVAGGPAPIPPRGTRAATREATVRMVAVQAPTRSDIVVTLPNSMRRVSLGESFFLEIWASRGSSVDTAAPGLASVYVDVSFDPEVLAVQDVQPSDSLPVFAQGAIRSTGRLLRVGGCAPVGNGIIGVPTSWARVATIEARGRSDGLATISIAPADVPFGISVFGNLGDLPPATVDFTGVDILLYEPTDLGQVIPDHPMDRMNR